MLPFSRHVALLLVVCFSAGARAEQAVEIEESPGPWPQAEAPEVVAPPPLNMRAPRALRVRRGAPPRHATAWSIAPTPRPGCNFAPSLDPTGARIAELGAGHASGMSCRMQSDDVGLDLLPANMHANVGVNKPLGGAVVTAWGLALEVPAGPLTPHVEVFGFDDGEPTVQMGLVSRPLPDLLFDGKVGRVDGINRYSVGMRLRF
jgi:hypothetical protein